MNTSVRKKHSKMQQLTHDVLCRSGRGSFRSSAATTIKDVTSLNFWGCQKLPCKAFSSVTFDSFSSVTFDSFLSVTFDSFFSSSSSPMVLVQKSALLKYILLLFCPAKQQNFRGWGGGVAQLPYPISLVPENNKL